MCQMVPVKTNFNTEIQVADIKKDAIRILLNCAAEQRDSTGTDQEVWLCLCGEPGIDRQGVKMFCRNGPQDIFGLDRMKEKW